MRRQWYRAGVKWLSGDICNKEDNVREHVAYLIVIGMFVLLALFMFAALGKGKYQPPPPEEQEKGSISHVVLL
jgi:hypothetical protein